MRMTSGILGILCAAGVVLAAPAARAAEAAKPAKGHEDKVVPAADTTWQPLDPKAPDGPQVALLWGEFNKAPLGFLLRVKAGTQFPRHSHTHDYDGVVVQGEWKHTYASETDSATLPAGSHWHQSGKKVHGDGCVAPTGECIVLVSYPHGKRDFIPAPEPKKP